MEKKTPKEIEIELMLEAMKFKKLYDIYLRDKYYEEEYQRIMDRELEINHLIH